MNDIIGMIDQEAEEPQERSLDPHGVSLPIYRPDLSGNERAYLLRCLETMNISTGEFVTGFEEAFAAITGARRAVSVSSGTAALHLSLHALGICAGDEVIVPTFTFVATVNAVIQTGAKPIFADCDPDSWVIGPDNIEPCITGQTRAIVVAHLYGAVCDVAAIQRMADRHGLLLIEDCAQAIGSTSQDRHVGRRGRVGTFSFYGNKTITAGEGGMIVTDDDDLAVRLRSLRNHAPSEDRRYWHTEPGFNYKMTNLSAAIGLAQIERLDATVARKRQIAKAYRNGLGGLPLTFQKCNPAAESAEWLFSLLLPSNIDRGEILNAMLDDGVEARPVFCCVHEMPPHSGGQRHPNAKRISQSGISLPSYPSLSDTDVERVMDALSHAMRNAG